MQGAVKARRQESLKDRCRFLEREMLHEKRCNEALKERMQRMLKEYQEKTGTMPEGFKPLGGKTNLQERSNTQRREKGEQKPYKRQIYQKPEEEWNDTIPRTDIESYGQNNPERKERKIQIEKLKYRKTRGQQKPLESGANDQDDRPQGAGPSGQQKIAASESIGRQGDAQEQKRRQLFVCAFCEGNHTSANCPIRATKGERLQQL